MPTTGTREKTEGGRTPLGRLLWIFAILLFLGPPVPLKADTLTLKSGDVLEGQIISETETQIEIHVSLYHGTIFATRQVDKSDIQSIVHETVEQKQEKAVYASLAKYTLNPNQELTKDQYAAGIAAFEKFQAKFTNSAATAEISKRLADWQTEAGNVASGKVKFASAWMTPEEKKVQAAQEALQSLKSQLADLQVQRAKLGATIATTQAKLTAAQGGTAASPGGGRRDLAGRLTAGVTTPQQEEAPTGQSGDVAAYQQQISQQQATLASLDAKINDIQSQIPQREQDSKLAIAQSKPGSDSNAPAKDAHPKKTTPPPPPPPEPPPPWYMRLWHYFHK
jgi:hypothetical protein